MRYLQEDLSRHRASTLSQLAEKDAELSRLSAELGAATAYRSRRESSLPAGVEPGTDALTQMTETLLQKQALLEAVTAEKTSLVLQIERLEVNKENFKTISC